ncbi:DUF1592 domain-containing protein [Lignipirellula cremea]|uniref:Planctomycete cytochrome C n=1 Tax=Lignipirellula cremea TaxID=2528010 RepID=A0A518DLG1_9BACT|nr:DUF1592 domain-containing protein [Lignipirellula cremea]QDU92665.1 Planctomycete cytochrome C [Lignipirellula cremea]
MISRSPLLVALVHSLIASCCFATVAAAAPNFDKDVQPYFRQHCLGCHGAEKQNGDFRIDTLSRKIGLEDTPQWAEIMERISSGEMPPEDVKNRPTADKSAAIVEWLAARIQEGEAARMAQRDRVSYHRLTREEYVNTVRDLLGVEYDATDPGGLLEDAEWNGFERVGSVMTLSATHIEKYINAAEIVLDEAYPDKPIEYLEATTQAAVVNENHPYFESLQQEGLLDKVRFELVTNGEQFRASSPYRNGLKFPGPGVYEISYVVSGLKPENGKAPRIQVFEEKLDRILFEQDIIAPEDAPITVTFQAHFPGTSTPQIRVMNTTGLPRHPRSTAHSRIPFINTSRPRAPWQVKITDQQGQPRSPVLIIDSITIRGPIITPLEQQRRDSYLPQEETIPAAREGLARLAKRAFRRPLVEGELEVYVQIVEQELAAGAPFREAVEAAMIAVLCSKSFLFIAEGDENADRSQLNDWEIASRLSYLLWSTMPDDELFAAAERGQLQDQGELQRQFTRMLNDPRSDRFKEGFSRQWLYLNKVGMFPPDKKLYPQYDDHLEQSMIGETQAFFAEVLEQRLTLREFLNSDWTMLNSRLARFYQVQGDFTDQFQRVALQPEDHRGGLLTQAAILSLTSDGARHRPVHRGVWLSEVILGKTPPPPPANVEPIEPNPVDSPKATLRMKLDAHKHDASCASCHKKIDPLGFAFDHYDAIGQWRTREQVEGTGEDPLVDASGELVDGRKFQNAEELKQLLTTDLDAFEATFIEKLAIYGLRRTMTFDDHQALAGIAKVGREKDYSVREILEAFVLSDLFQQR